MTPPSQADQQETSIGLGLYSTKRMIELHKGNISVESKVGRGTRIKIELPVQV